MTREPADGGRTPYTERDRLIRDHCTCSYVWSEGPGEEVTRHERYWRDPACPLHGDDREEAPF